ncbi:IS3 family transposase [Candidatus Parcubacteria bacterium]|nr:IS3 family transposase [Candidatus Parcubacteria bacterium]
MLCVVADVSRSGYYKWLARADEPQKDYEDYLLVKKVFEKGKSKLGWRTVKMKLLSDYGVIMNHKKIQRVMKKYGLQAKIRRVNPYRMAMKKSLEHRTFENLLNRQFTQDKPLNVFCTDITYLPYNHKMAYLSVVKDIATGEVMSWNLSQHIDMNIVMQTIERMKAHPLFTTASLTDILIHSDQGVHYTHPDYIRAIQELGMRQSMSRKGNCIDNAPIESFFGHLKDDMDYKNCKTFNELYSRTEQHMRYYNYERPQWNLKKMTPVGYRNHLLTAA